MGGGHVIGTVGADGKSHPHADFYPRIMHGNFLTFNRQTKRFIFNLPFFCQTGRAFGQKIAKTFTPGDHLQ